MWPRKRGNSRYRLLNAKACSDSSAVESFMKESINTGFEAVGME